MNNKVEVYIEGGYYTVEHIKYLATKIDEIVAKHKESRVVCNGDDIFTIGPTMPGE